ncbi:hypothetical protein [Azospirillum thermophilum]|uniref:hypothetical protein n=1 Tax=Azospirillum thermophilum TaxID=2202148 RepID=UPI0011B40F8E|nr:hypothetical protein [Azospirillum thermophilum]
MADRETSGTGGPNRKTAEATGRSQDGNKTENTSRASGQTGDRTGDGGVGGTLGRMGSEAADHAMDVGRETLGGAQGRIRGLLEQQTGRAADQLGSVAAALHKAADELNRENSVAAQYAVQAAERVDDMADMLRNATMDDMLHRVEGFARRQPEMFLGAAFAVGFLAARFIKSSGEQARYGSQRAGYGTVSGGSQDYGRGYARSSGFSGTPSRAMAGGIAESGTTPRRSGTTAGGGMTGGVGQTAGAPGGQTRSGGISGTMRPATGMPLRAAPTASDTPARTLGSAPTAGGSASGVGSTTGPGGPTGTAGAGTSGLPQNTATAATTAARTRDAADMIANTGNGPSAKPAATGAPAGGTSDADRPAVGTKPQGTLP